MIRRSQDFDLGRDQTRMKNPADPARQHRTVDRLLETLFAEDPDKRWELQLVADEVGMGKTFVALGAAFSVLKAMDDGHAGAQLSGAQRTVVVIAPSQSLLKKWEREVPEFVRRCFEPADAELLGPSFAPTRVERFDDLAALLRGRRSHGGVLVTYMDVLSTGRKVMHYDLKRRFTLAALFAFWGERFPADSRRLFLNGAPEGWPRRAEELAAFAEEEMARLPFASVEDARAALSAAAEAKPQTAKALDDLLATCVELARPHTRERAEKFKKEVEGHLVKWVYREACFGGIAGAIPLVIVDEAHNWKNGPSEGKHGYSGFRQFLGPLTRRAVLLTATPFQLRPEEMLQLLRVGEDLGLDASPARASERRARLAKQRTSVIAPVLAASADQSRMFAREWARVPPKRMDALGAAWTSPEIRVAREELRVLANQEGVVNRVVTERVIATACAGLDPDLRAIVREGLRLYCFNADLSQELGTFVIRHRRRVEHRLFQVGEEFGDASLKVLQRGDKAALHAAQGLDVRGPGELPHYLLMRCVSEMKAGKGRSSLGSALTGCYSTLLESAEGKTLQKKLKDGPGGRYFELLAQLVDASKDPEHPKVKAVVDQVLEAWRAGEKTLVFCFRTHTARRLHEILKKRVDEEIEARRERVVGSKTALENFRSRFTRRDDELVLLSLDRVIWSLLWAARSGVLSLPEIEPSDLVLTDEELHGLAGLAIRYGVDLRAETLDRVFLHRATEHLLAKRILARKAPGSSRLFRSILQELAETAWVERPYGVDTSAPEGEDDETAAIHAIDGRGVHGVYTVSRSAVAPREVDELAEALRERRARAERSGESVLDGYARAPSFWLGADPQSLLDGAADAATRTVTPLHEHLLNLTRDGATLAWGERLRVFQALRQAILRDSILVRLMPERTDDEQRTWGVLLVEALYARLKGQHETMADRLSVFVEDMQAASGKITQEGSMRRSLYEGTRLRGEDQVVLIDGSTAQERRERVFAGFNSPLVPEVLLCTQVGQEGIDLHRHCRHVVHYDLAWNPAVVEQRTGRVDRIGSKTFRERDRGQLAVQLDGTAGHLSVGVPYLAGTYDERMYEELRVRAQTFEVLTGGDVSMDNLEGKDDDESAEGEESGVTYPVLPKAVVDDLRVSLHVWEAT